MNARGLVQSVSISTTQYVDPAGTPVPSSQLIGTGPALLFRNGHEMIGTWNKADRTSVTALTAADGTKMVLQIGQTWVELAPSGANISVNR